MTVSTVGNHVQINQVAEWELTEHKHFIQFDLLKFIFPVSVIYLNISVTICCNRLQF